MKQVLVRSTEIMRQRMKAGTISRNALAALGQAVFVSGCLFLVYRAIVRFEGLDYLGLWSLLMIGSSVARVSDVSGAGALGRFIAMNQAGVPLGGSASEIVHTVLLTSVAINFMICLPVLAAAPLALSFVVPPDLLAEGLVLLPYVLVMIVLAGLVSGITSGIDGLQRADLRAAVLSTSALAMLGTSYVLVPRYGMQGFAVAQIISQGATILMGWSVLRLNLPDIGWLPTRWNRGVFSKTAAYGVKLNSIGVLVLLFEPFVKFCFGLFGGAAQVGLYELALRTILQVRGLVLAAAMPLVPAIAALDPKKTGERDGLVKNAMYIVAVAAPAVTFVTLAAAPVISLIVLDELSLELFVMAIPLIFAWSTNIIGIPFYLAAQANGRMRWNALSHLIAALCVPLGAIMAGDEASASLIWAVVAGIVVSTAVSVIGNAHLLGLASILRGSATRLLVGLSIISTGCGAAYGLATRVLN